MHRFLRDYGFTIDRVDYPYFDTPYFTAQNLARLLNTSEVSPPFYGNFMTFYCHKPDRGAAYHALRELSRTAAALAESLDGLVAKAAKLLEESLCEGNVLIWADDSSRMVVQALVDELPPGRQARIVRQAGDVASISPALLIAVSVDVCSRDLRELLEAARHRGCKTIALFGGASESLEGTVDVCIPIDCQSRQRIREVQATLLHCLCDQISNGPLLRPTLFEPQQQR
jgi:hypothetical protein